MSGRCLLPAINKENTWQRLPLLAGVICKTTHNNTKEKLFHHEKQVTVLPSPVFPVISAFQHGKLLLSADNIIMDIQSLSVEMSQARLEEEASAKVAAMIMRDIRKGTAELTGSAEVEAAEPISDPSKGNFLDRYI